MGRFLFSFFKELNSATNKNMIALALVLGLISGFLPTFTFINYIIFFVVLIFRIPIGLYFASFAVFGLIGYMFDWFFNKIGYMVLTSSILKPLWTYLYNLPLVRWSGFNNTLVMGSLISSIVVGIVFYVFLVKSIDKYRKSVFPKIKNIKYLSWIVPDEEKKGFIRISGIAFSVLIVGLISFLIVVFLDPLVKFVLSYSLSKTLHKDVEIQTLHTKIFSPSVLIENMKIDNFLIKKACVKLNMKNLLWKKYDIEKATFIVKTNVTLKEFLKSKKSISKKSEISFNLPKIKLPNPKDIINSPNLYTTKAIKKLEEDYKRAYNFYKTLNLNEYKKEIDNLKKQIDSLKNIKINNLDDIERVKRKIENIKKEINSLNSSVKTKINELKAYKKLLLEDIKNVKLALRKDYKNIQNQYLMIKNKEYISFAQIYLKPQISKYLNYLNKIFEKIKPYLANNKKPKKIPRKGIYIKFEDKIHYPDFVIRDLNAKLTNSIAKYRLTIKNLSDNQRLLNKKAILSLIGDSKFYYVKVYATYLNKVNFNGIVKNVKLDTLNFNGFEILHPVVFVSFAGNYEKTLFVKANVLFKGCKISFKTSKYSKIINSILSKINEFNVYIVYENDKLKVSSDIDKIISKALKKFYLKEIEKQKSRAIKLLNEKVNKELAKYNLKGIDAKLNSLNDMNGYLNQLLKEAEKSLIEKEKNKIENKIFEKIKLF